MARQFTGRLTREALRSQVAAQAVTPAAAAQDASVGTDAELVTDWLTRLHLLNGVPFNYLVPDAAMLPAESIRFFAVDPNWIEALLDGAYSVGFAGVSESVAAQARPAFREAAATRARTGTHRAALLAQAAPRTIPVLPATPLTAPAAVPVPETLTGFLLRSAVVAGWPGLEVHGFADLKGTTPVPIVRMEILAPSLLLVLLGGTIERVDLQEPSEAVHFGVDAATGGAWQKKLRYANGNDSVTVGSYIDDGSVPVTPRATASGSPFVIRVDTVAQAMTAHVWTTPPPSDTAFTAAQFALEMVEGVEAVSFQLSPSPKAGA